MYTLKKFIEYFTLTGISFGISYFLVYGNTPDFENNFNSVNLNILEFFTVYQLSNLALFAIILFLFNYDSESNYFLLSFCSFNFLLIIFLWVIKFTNLSRYFILLSLLAFVASLFLSSRFLKKEIQLIFLTIDESIEIPNTIWIKTDSKNFPSDLIEKIIYTLKNKNLTGIIINSQESSNVLYKQLLEVSNFFGIELFELKRSKLKLIHKPSKLNLVVKNLEDLVLSLIFLPVFSVVLIIFAVIIVIFDGFPIFYVQKRVGQNGKLFNIYKFRTMKVHNLDNEDLEELNERDKIVFKSSNDPRITKLGAFLRKSSIDELPQYLNILKNEMSFIGPRPPIPSEVVKYELKHLKRISVKPGITGLWQVTLRNDNNFDNWVEKDIEYIDNWSFKMDVKIFLKTFREIFKLTGS
jgi:lipopolysaccharide/colanic/teichoic acid biosynthesis glycosyltransferase